MPDASSEVSRDELIAYVEKHGLTVTADQLVRWHKKGLLPRPRRRHLGRGKGTESVYPSISAAQACAIVMLLEIFPRDLDSVGWCLWCFGFAITPYVRASLLTYLKEEKGKTSKRYQAMVDGTQDSFLAALSEGRSPPGWGRVRRRLGRTRTGEVAAVLSRLLLGHSWPTFTDTADEESEYEVVLKAMRSQLGIAEDSAKARQHDVKDVPEALNLLAGEFNLTALKSALEKAPARALIYLRDEIQTILRRSSTFPGADQAIVPKELFLAWFALRYASPTSRDAFKTAPNETRQLLVAEPSIVAQAMIERIKATSAAGKKTAAPSKKTKRKKS